jgi:cytochrome c-type biogenesis protein CcmH/NrfF
VAARLAVWIALTAGLVTASPAWAAEHEDVAARISKEVISPFCDGVTLHDCPSTEADELRREIAAWARSGMSEREILARLEREYGAIRAVPDNPVAWLPPGGVVIAGMALVVVLARRWARRSPPTLAPHGVASETRARIDAELGSYRRRP